MTHLEERPVTRQNGADHTEAGSTEVSGGVGPVHEGARHSEDFDNEAGTQFVVGNAGDNQGRSSCGCKNGGRLMASCRVGA